MKAASLPSRWIQACPTFPSRDPFAPPSAAPCTPPPSTREALCAACGPPLGRGSRSGWGEASQPETERAPPGPAGASRADRGASRREVACLCCTAASVVQLPRSAAQHQDERNCILLLHNRRRRPRLPVWHISPTAPWLGKGVTGLLSYP